MSWANLRTVEERLDAAIAFQEKVRTDMQGVHKDSPDYGPAVISCEIAAAILHTLYAIKETPVQRKPGEGWT